MKRQDKAKIDSLLHELRSRDPDEEGPLDIEDLARRFQLDPLVVERIAESEGWDVATNGVPEPVEDDHTTPISIDTKK